MATLHRQSTSERELDDLYTVHSGEIFRFSLSILGNREDAEDAVQTTFINAFRALERGDRPDKPRAWLFAIAQNACRERLRTQARRPSEVPLDPELAESLSSGDDTPSAEQIRRALKELVVNQRIALTLREIQGLSYDEIARVLGVSPSAVETLLHRARDALREQFEAAEAPLACENALRLIPAQLDKRLSAAESRALRAHLRTCDSCALRAKRLRGQKRVLRGLAPLPLLERLAGALKLSGGASVGTKAAALAATAVTGTGVAIGTAALADRSGSRADVQPPAKTTASPEASAPGGLLGQGDLRTRVGAREAGRVGQNRPAAGPADRLRRKGVAAPGLGASSLPPTTAGSSAADQTQVGPPEVDAPTPTVEAPDLPSASSDAVTPTVPMPDLDTPAVQTPAVDRPGVKVKSKASKTPSQVEAPGLD